MRKWEFSTFTEAKAKYDIGLILKNGTLESISELEPLSSQIYTDFDFKSYLDTEQLNTSINLSDKIRQLEEERNHDVLVYVDGRKMNSKTMHVLNNISEMVLSRLERKQFRISFFKRMYYRFFKKSKPIININEGIRLEKKLIKNNAQ